MTAYANGRIPKHALTRIPGPNAYLEHNAAVAWLDMREYIIACGGPAIRPLGPNSSYRVYARQVEYYHKHQVDPVHNPVAAYPGTSNHGWGVAVDVATPEMAYWIRRVGRRFGWSWDEGQRAGEWWHFRYVGGYKPGPWRALTPHERILLREYTKLKKSKKDKKRQRRLKRELVAMRKSIWRAAQKAGWNKANRRQRYQLLAKYT